MIFIFHSAYYVFKFLLRNYKRFQFLKYRAKLLSLENFSTISNGRDVEENLSFDPPVYRQRYAAVQKVLLDYRWRKHIKKIVDFGCAEFGLFMYIKHLLNVEKIICVDIAEDLLYEYLFKIRPLTVDYLKRRPNPLVVEVFAGSVSFPDVRLLHADAVIAIELIEHLYPDTLDALPYNIFAFIQPKIAIFTTPNADFNKLFPSFKKFRHADHKFEWTRKQFEDWAINITHRFPQYSVYFEGIGEGPTNTQQFGTCSQMAVFVKSAYIYNRCKEMSDSKLSSSSEATDLVSSEYDLESSSCEKLPLCESLGVCTYFSYSKQMLDYEKSADKNVQSLNQHYKLVEKIEYPYDVDQRTSEEVILHELQYTMHLIGRMWGRYYNDEKDRAEIPLVDLVYSQRTVMTSTTEASVILQKAGYKIEGCINPSTEELELCVIYEPEMESHSCLSEVSDSVGDSEWESVGEAETSPTWDVTSNQTSSAWTAVKNNNPKAFDSAGKILHEIVNKIEDSAASNVQNKSSDTSGNWHTDDTDTSRDNFTDLQSDSSILNTQIHSPLNNEVPTLNAEEIDKNAQQMKGVETFLKVEVKNEVAAEAHPVVVQKEDVVNLLPRTGKKGFLKKVSEVLNKKEVLKDEDESRRGQKGIELVKKNPNKEGPPKDMVNEFVLKRGKVKENNDDFNKKGTVKDGEDATAGGSNVKKKKKQRKNGYDENVKEQLNIKEEDEVNRDEGKLSPEAACFENGLINELLLDQVQLPVVENGDLVNNNRDNEGNNYPNAGPNEEEIEHADNENQNRVVENGGQLNEDIQNRNGNNELQDEREPLRNVELRDEPIEEPLEVEQASREALFDPNSQIDLLEGYPMPAEENQQSPPQPPQDGLVVIGINQIDEENGPVLPPHANPFPNWLLHLLENEEIGNLSLHDEPHFYCQGDGIGVHPSIIEVDLDDDSTESESEDTTRSALDNITVHTASQSDMLSFLQESDSRRSNQSQSNKQNVQEGSEKSRNEWSVVCSLQGEHSVSDKQRTEQEQVSNKSDVSNNESMAGQKLSKSSHVVEQQAASSKKRDNKNKQKEEVKDRTSNIEMQAANASSFTSNNAGCSANSSSSSIVTSSLEEANCRFKISHNNKKPLEKKDKGKEKDVSDPT